MSAVAHADAVIAALTSAGVAAYEQPDAPESPDPPHAVVYGDLGRGETYRMNGRSKVTAYRVPVLVVGGTPNNARYAADAVTSALHGLRLAVTGSLCTPVRLESSTPVRNDDTDPAGTYVSTLVFTFASSPAS